MLQRGYVLSPNSTVSLSTSWSSGILLSTAADTANARALPSSPHLTDLTVQVTGVADGTTVTAYLSYDSAGAKPAAGVSAAATAATFGGGLAGGCAFSLNITKSSYWGGETRGQLYLWLKLSAGTGTLVAKGAVLGWTDSAAE